MISCERDRLKKPGTASAEAFSVQSKTAFSVSQQLFGVQYVYSMYIAGDVPMSRGFFKKYLNCTFLVQNIIFEPKRNSDITFLCTKHDFTK